MFAWEMKNEKDAEQGKRKLNEGDCRRRQEEMEKPRKSGKGRWGKGDIIRVGHSLTSNQASLLTPTMSGPLLATICTHKEEY